jgi:hypothetical protein
MRRLLQVFSIVISMLVFHAYAGPGHNHGAFERGPNGGQLIDAGPFHLELIVAGNDLTLHVADLKDKKLSTKGATASADVISRGTKSLVELTPSGENLLVGKGMFTADKSMRVLVRLRMPGKGTIQGKFMPLQNPESKKP